MCGNTVFTHIIMMCKQCFSVFPKDVLSYATLLFIIVNSALIVFSILYIKLRIGKSVKEVFIGDIPRTIVSFISFTVLIVFVRVFTIGVEQATFAVLAWKFSFPSCFQIPPSLSWFNFFLLPPSVYLTVFLLFLLNSLAVFSLFISVIMESSIKSLGETGASILASLIYTGYILIVNTCFFVLILSQFISFEYVLKDVPLNILLISPLTTYAFPGILQTFITAFIACTLYSKLKSTLGISIASAFLSTFTVDSITLPRTTILLILFLTCIIGVILLAESKIALKTSGKGEKVSIWDY